MVSLARRTWQMRRVVVTNDVIAFAFVGDDTQIDHIPFAEILHVKAMPDLTIETAVDEHLKLYTFAMQIATRDDGFNSGRTYYLSTHSQHTLDELIQCLSHKAQAARAQAETRTAFQRLQLRVRRRYESPLFQGLMAVLIAAVRRRASDARLLTLHGKQTSIAPASIVP